MPPRWILAVDDDPMILMIIEDALSDLGITVTTASDAKQAFIQARDLKPLLVISDINMPLYGDGVSALTELRKDKRLAGIPFLFISGMDAAQARAKLPPNDPLVRLLGKPLQIDELRKTVLEMLPPDVRQGLTPGGAA